MKAAASPNGGLFQKWLEEWKSHLADLSGVSVRRLRQCDATPCLREQTLTLPRLSVSVDMESADQFRLKFRMNGTRATYEVFVNREGLIAAETLLGHSAGVNSDHALSLNHVERQVLAEWLSRISRV